MDSLTEASSAPSALGTGSRVRRPSGALLSDDNVNQLIARIYQAKLQTDAAAARARDKGKTPDRSVRFDKFVSRFFKRSHGTVGIARRHLRAFVRSVEALATAGDDADHPRAKLFSRLAGVGNARAFNARLMPLFLLPTLKRLYPDPIKVPNLLKGHRGSADGAEPIKLPTLLDALENALPASLRGPAFSRRFAAAVEPAVLDKERKLCDPDAALLLAFPAFQTLDALLTIRRKHAAKVATRVARAWLDAHRGKSRADAPPRSPRPGDPATNSQPPPAPTA